ncbi:MAG TPA: rhodanese-like domain-containing protein [Flavobacterium sp.]|nr:rhodanese-like domain-containing protein [Flavobacterium sp.]
MDLEQKKWWEQANNDADAVILDVRTEEEVEEKSIPHMLHIDFYQGQGFLDELEKLDKNKSYYVYCKSGGRSGQACMIMQQLGFEKAFNLVGGITEWEGPVK